MGICSWQIGIAIMGSFLAGILLTLFTTTLRKGVGMRLIRFTIAQKEGLRLVPWGRYQIYEVEVQFSLSCLMKVIQYISLFPEKREPVIADVKFRYDGQTSWGHEGIWRDTGTIVTIVNDVGIKFLIVATTDGTGWFPINKTEGQRLPNTVIVEVQLKSQRYGKLLGKPLISTITQSNEVLSNRG